MLLAAFGWMIALILMVAALEKLLAFARWRSALARYPVGAASLPGLVYAVPGGELAVAALLLGGQQPAAGLVAAGLFAGFSGVLAISSMRGARHDCGCWGGSAKSRVGPAATYRALGLGVVSLLTTLGDSTGVPWYIPTTVVMVGGFGWLIAREFAGDLRGLRSAMRT